MKNRTARRNSEKRNSERSVPSKQRAVGLLAGLTLVALGTSCATGTEGPAEIPAKVTKPAAEADCTTQSNIFVLAPGEEAVVLKTDPLTGEGWVVAHEPVNNTTGERLESHRGPARLSIKSPEGKVVSEVAGQIVGSNAEATRDDGSTTGFVVENPNNTDTDRSGYTVPAEAGLNTSLAHTSTQSLDTRLVGLSVDALTLDDSDTKASRNGSLVVEARDQSCLIE